MAPSDPADAILPMRLFVALDLPWSLRETLTGLCGGLPGARWVAPQNLHLTLRFIGETRSDIADEIDLALQSLQVRRFELALAGTGTFVRARRMAAPHRSAHRAGNILTSMHMTTTLWAGIGRREQLDHLQSKIETALQRIGLAPERRRFQPHVSLARVDGVAEAVLGGWVQAHNLLRTEPVTIDSFTLFSSQPGPDQPVYTAEVDYALI